MNRRKHIAILALLFMGCAHQENNSLFDGLDARQTGISFRNTITESDSVNLFVNEYTYMGSGVGVGDFNRDGKPDVFLAGSQVSSRLYINEGDYHFKDVTEKAGLHTNAWCTGVSIVDINNDGYPDIYVCVSGNIPGRTSRNMLFINNHDLTFTESAAAYGLAFSGYSTQAVFFDFDKDGDLDMYLLNHRLDHDRPNNIVQPDTSGLSPAADKLFVNTGIDPVTRHPVYKDGSLAAGIKEDGYGLGVAVSDFNGDNWPDIYVSNDYLGNDELWLNNRDGTFTNTIKTSVRHQSYSGMGVDVADINNDGLPDLMTLDMMPEENSRKKTMYSFMSYERYQMERDAGYSPEFMRNMLQLNNGNLPSAAAIPFFSEIGQLAGVSETDWSWSVLLADFDNDGWKDIHITNGMGKDLTNADFVQFRADSHMEDNTKEGDERHILMNKLNSYGPVRLPNYFYHNNHDLTFSDESAAAGITEPTTSNGAAYADFRNKGRLDLIINNINQPASLLANRLNDSAAHYLRFVLKGDSLNKDAIGTKITLYYKDQSPHGVQAGIQTRPQTRIQTLEEYPVRGYLSSVDPVLHAGLGNVKTVDSITITWPNDRIQRLKNINTDQTLTLLAPSASEAAGMPQGQLSNEQLFEETQAPVFRHTETFFNDYSIQRLLPQKYSQLGPFISSADVNRDGLMDFFIGGAFNQSGEVFLQQKDGTFEGEALITGKKESEDMGSFFFDANEDGYPDLLIAGGSDEFSPGSAVYTPKLFLNDGKGHFTEDTRAIPAEINTSASVVTGAMFGNKTIIFIGGRVGWQYPLSPGSYLLQNDHGRLKDVTAEICPALKEAGMVTSAVWTDFTGDGQPDLVVAGEWMPVRFFANEHGLLKEVTPKTNLCGQWRSLVAVDIDHDGDMDLIVGNLGLNNKYHVGPQRPLTLLAADLDNNGILDPVAFYYIKDKTGNRRLFPAISRDQLAQQVPAVKRKFLYYASYAKAVPADIYPGKQTAVTAGALTPGITQKLICTETRSGWYENKGNSQFVFHPLPLEAQFAPVNALVCADLDGDGWEDLVIAGNEYQVEPMTGRYDAGYGLFLKGDGKGHFIAQTPVRSGLILDGDIKDLRLIPSAGGGKCLLAAVNDDYMKLFKLNHP